jgi:hypothetical protein
MALASCDQGEVFKQPAESAKDFVARAQIKEIGAVGKSRLR